MASGAVTFEDLIRFHREVIVPDLDARFGRMEAWFDRQLDERLEQRLDERFGQFAAVVMSQFAAVDARFDRLETKVDAHHLEMLDNFDGVYARLDEVSIDYQAMKNGLRSVEDRVTKLERDRS